MKIIVEIPKEFEHDYETDSFADCFERVLADFKNNIKQHGYGVAGNYELETLEMLKIAIAKSAKCIGDDDRVYSPEISTAGIESKRKAR